MRADSGNASSAGMPSGPTVSGPRSSQISSTRPAATKDDATREPPSTISLVMPLSDSARSTAGKSSPGGLAVAATRITCAPAAPSFMAAGASAKSEVITHSGVWRADWTSLLVPGMRSARSSTTRTGERGSMPGRRQVSSGSSASTVPMPTRMASHCARNRCTRVLATSPDIATGLWPAAAILSSAETASLRMTCGRLSRMRRKCPA